MTALHHVVAWEKALTEAIRVLRPGGRLIGYDLLDTALVRLLHFGSGHDTRLLRAGQLQGELDRRGIADVRAKPVWATWSSDSWRPKPQPLTVVRDPRPPLAAPRGLTYERRFRHNRNARSCRTRCRFRELRDDGEPPQCQSMMNSPTRPQPVPMVLCRSLIN